eukprot:2170177-Pleurochrysis_carterae.AAC.5
MLISFFFLPSLAKRRRFVKNRRAQTLRAQLSRHRAHCRLINRESCKFNPLPMRWYWFGFHRAYPI